ncbi:MAG: hypothetical protein AABY11_03380, partial [archaeon]
LKIDPNKNQQFISQVKTDITGKASFIAPPSLPNTRFVFDAQKGGYESTPVEVKVDQNLMVFEPKKLSFALPNTPNTEQFLPVEITNVTQDTFILSNASISGNFQGLLSVGEMQSFIAQYNGVVSIGSLESEDIQVKAATSPSVNVIGNKTLNGSAVFTFKRPSGQQEWVQHLPLTVGIKILSECDEGGIQIAGLPSGGKIETTAFEPSTQIPIQIYNSCTVNGQPVSLQNLQAKIEWDSIPLGNLEFALTDIQDSAQAIDVLKNGKFVPLFQTFKPVESTVYEGILTFTPFPGNIGEEAKFSVTIGATTGPTNTSTLIQESFDMDILITNLETCVVFSPSAEEGITIEHDEDETEFQVNTSACGDIPIDFFFCAGSTNSNCSGGAPEGRLYLSQYTIDDLSGSRTITVERRSGTLPGTYDITVDARVPGGSYHQIGAIETFIESDATYAFSLDKSDFILYQQGAKDSAVVTNALLQETIKGTASKCHWGTASKSDGNLGTIGGATVAGAAIGEYIGGVYGAAIGAVIGLVYGTIAAVA